MNPLAAPTLCTVSASPSSRFASTVKPSFSVERHQKLLLNQGILVRTYLDCSCCVSQIPSLGSESQKSSEPKRYSAPSVGAASKGGGGTNTWLGGLVTEQDSGGAP